MVVIPTAHQVPKDREQCAFLEKSPRKLIFVAHPLLQSIAGEWKRLKQTASKHWQLAKLNE